MDFRASEILKAVVFGFVFPMAFLFFVIWCDGARLSNYLFMLALAGPIFAMFSFVTLLGIQDLRLDKEQSERLYRGIEDFGRRKKIERMRYWGLSDREIRAN
ncbi:hypothetical protein LCGC14_2039290 [marine sediment metagenome]|uniref:Uncharacterized protein n=1 Tax=marine sediment metagenome TaxID=412755 RepID=A0A0F9H5T1_9ZZZZ